MIDRCNLSLHESTREIASERRQANPDSQSQFGSNWQSFLFAAKLRDLRSREEMTLEEVAEKSGIDESSLLDLEHQISAPGQDHLEALAKAFDIRPEALKLTDISLFPANALIQLGETYGLMPRTSSEAGGRDDRFAILEPKNPYMTVVLSLWARKYHELERGKISRKDYERWKDRFFLDFNPEDFPLRYKKRANGYKEVSSWESTQLASALQRLRKESGYSQERLGNECGGSKTAIRAYERKQRPLTKKHRKNIASILKISEGALVFYDFGSPPQAAHALFQIANQYGLIPQILDGVPVLRTIQIGLERYIDQWAWALQGIYENATIRNRTASSYQDWKDMYDPRTMSGTKWESRYSFHLSSSNELLGEMDSENDPFDERYADQGGFLRA